MLTKGNWRLEWMQEFSCYLKNICSQSKVSSHSLSRLISIEDKFKALLNFCSTWHWKLWIPLPTSPFNLAITKFSAYSTAIEKLLLSELSFLSISWPLLFCYIICYDLCHKSPVPALRTYAKLSSLSSNHIGCINSFPLQFQLIFQISNLSMPKF